MIDATPAQLIFGKYEMIRRLAVGGMGEIFLARQHGIPGFERLVILKSLLPEFTESDDSVNQFLDEARVAATLNHPNIVSIFEVGRWEGTYYIAMEYIHGVTVAGLLVETVRRKVTIPYPVVAHIIHDAALALDHAHNAVDTAGKALSIVHRDVSPQNIMVRRDGVTKVVDFGIAKATNVTSRTRTGAVKGKLGYLSPEQASGQTLDARSDQFALGTVAWELVARRRLFSSDNAVITIKKILEDPIPRLSTVVDGCPPPLEEAVARMLSRDPAARFGRCVEVASAIKVYLDGTTSQVGAVEVAAFVERVCAERIDETIRDLTPSAKENFIVSLAGAQTVTIGQGAKSHHGARRFATLAAIALVTGFAATGLVWWQTPTAVVTPPAPVATLVPAATPTPPPAKASLRVTSKPAGARVRLGERSFGATPVTIDGLAPDTDHSLALELKGFEPANLTVHLGPGQHLDQEVQLNRQGKRRGQRKGGAAASSAAVTSEGGVGYLSIATVPWTLVYHGSQLLGETTFTKKELKAGTYNLRLVNEDAGIAVSRTVEIKAGEVTKLNLKLK